jgi:drug/metabolite transporter (DMT)-like permease
MSMHLTPISQYYLGFALAFLGTTLFSLKSIFIKILYNEGLDANQVLILRMIISLPIYLFIILHLHQTTPKTQRHLIQKFLPKTFGLGVIGYFLASLLDLKGLEYISASLERLTLFTYPIFISILGAIFFNTPLQPKIIISLILSYFGIWLVFETELTFSQQTSWKGVTFVLFSALSYSFYVLLSKPVISIIGSKWFTSLAMTSSCVVAISYGIFYDTDLLSLSYQAWFWAFILALFSTVIPSFMITAAINSIGTAQTSIVGTLGPVITIILAVIILNEPFYKQHIIGMLSIITGVMILTIPRKTP